MSIPMSHCRHFHGASSLICALTESGKCHSVRVAQGGVTTSPSNSTVKPITFLAENPDVIFSGCHTCPEADIEMLALTDRRRQRQR